MQILFDIQNNLISSVTTTFQRFLYRNIDFQERLIAVIGPRGVGKTTLILQHLKSLKKINYLYVSADNIYFTSNSLFDLTKRFYDEYAGELLCIDEIHKYPNWNQELKNIVDSFPDLKIIISGSSSLELKKGYYDLSRRGVIYRLPGLSFREFLELKTARSFPTIKIQDLFNNAHKHTVMIDKDIRVQKYFKDYLRYGYYPFFIENIPVRKAELYSKIINIIDKIIYEDITNFYNLKTENLNILRKIIYFLSTMKPGKININSIANSINRDHKTVERYLEYFRETGLIRELARVGVGHKLIRKATKIFLDNTVIFNAINELETTSNQEKLGMIRELFVINQLQNSSHIIQIAKMGDFYIDSKYTIEIGGKNKTMKQIKGTRDAYLVLADINIATKYTIPIYLFGFLY